MNYELIGGKGKQETRYAEYLCERFFAEIDPSVMEPIGLIGLNPHWRRERELDFILIISWLGTQARRFDVRPEHQIPIIHTDEFVRSSQKIKLNTLVASIEIKSHDIDGIDIQGDDLYVLYQNRDKNGRVTNTFWDAATTKLNAQGTSAERFLRSQFELGSKTGAVPLIYLPKVSKAMLRDRIAGRPLENSIIFSDSTFEEFLYKVLRRNGVEVFEGYHFLGTQKNTLNDRVVYHRIRKYYEQLNPTRIEQDRMEEMSKQIVARSNTKWDKELGQKAIRFFGRAGTGKTVYLLNIANFALEQQGKRCLFLTFNRALVRDLQRIMQLQSLNNKGSIMMRTIDQFLYEVAGNLDLISTIEAKTKTGDEEYFSFVRELIHEALMTEANIAKAKSLGIARSADYILIDEAQDWLEVERDILLKLFPAQNVIFAEGSDQCLRAYPPANWEKDIKARGTEIYPFRLERGLRQQHDLAIFNNELAKLLRIDWRVIPNEENPGGKVFFFESLNDDVIKLFLREYLDDHTENSLFRVYDAIDYLALVPASDAKRQENIKELVTQTGASIWDGATSLNRDKLPERNQLRMVSLESCRGLEGYATLITGLDYWLQFCMERAAELNPDGDYTQMEALPSWFLIPFTRGKARLLVELPKSDTIRKPLMKMIQENPANVTLL